MWWACPLFAMILAITGIGISKLSPDEIKAELETIQAKKDEAVSIADI